MGAGRIADAAPAVAVALFTRRLDQRRAGRKRSRDRRIDIVQIDMDMRCRPSPCPIITIESSILTSACITLPSSLRISRIGSTPKTDLTK